LSDQEVGDTDFGVQVGLGSLGNASSAVVGMIGAVILARVLGPDGYGLFYVTLGIANLFENPVNGWATACKKRLTETDFDAGEALGSVLVMTFVLSLVGAPFAYFTLSLTTTNEIIPLAVPILFIPMSTYWALTRILSGRSNFSLAAWSTVSHTLFKITSQVVLVVLGFDVWGMIGGAAVGSILVIPIVYRWIGVRPVFPSRSSFASIGEFAKWSIPQGFVGTALSRMDVILLGWLSSSAIAGNYQVALKLTLPAMFISSAINNGLMARVSNLESRGDYWSEDVTNALSLTSLLAIPIAFGAITIGEEVLVTIYSNQYAGAGSFLIGLAIYRLLVTVSSPLESVVVGLDYPRLSFYISLTRFVLNVTAGLILWYLIGPIGIVVATVIAQVLSYLMYVAAVRSLANRTAYIPQPLLKQILAGAVMALSVWVARQFVGAQEVLTVILLVALGAIVYSILLIVISPFIRVTAKGIYADLRSEYIMS